MVLGIASFLHQKAHSIKQKYELTSVPYTSRPNGASGDASSCSSAQAHALLRWSGLTTPHIPRRFTMHLFTCRQFTKHPFACIGFKKHPCIIFYLGILRRFGTVSNRLQ
ncbi:hypothetical protein HMPREF9069_01307 [Atopobium sp. oral taxon 810 str. F0209]|nr:hypothetical protein HMPREF9069_01307 [Atopobium sp. oral taxon 810 str. F0209]